MSSLGGQQFIGAAKPYTELNPSGISASDSLSTLLTVGEGSRNRTLQRRSQKLQADQLALQEREMEARLYQEAMSRKMVAAQVALAEEDRRFAMEANQLNAEGVLRYAQTRKKREMDIAALEQTGVLASTLAALNNTTIGSPEEKGSFAYNLLEVMNNKVAGEIAHTTNVLKQAEPLWQAYLKDQTPDALEAIAVTYAQAVARDPKDVAAVARKLSNFFNRTVSTGPRPVGPDGTEPLPGELPPPSLKDALTGKDGIVSKLSKRATSAKASLDSAKGAVGGAVLDSLDDPWSAPSRIGSGLGQAASDAGNFVRQGAGALVDVATDPLVAGTVAGMGGMNAAFALRALRGEAPWGTPEEGAPAPSGDAPSLQGRGGGADELKELLPLVDEGRLRTLLSATSEGLVAAPWYAQQAVVQSQAGSMQDPSKAPNVKMDAVLDELGKASRGAGIRIRSALGEVGGSFTSTSGTTHFNPQTWSFESSGLVPQMAKTMWRSLAGSENSEAALSALQDYLDGTGEGMGPNVPPEALEFLRLSGKDPQLGEIATSSLKEVTETTLNRIIEARRRFGDVLPDGTPASEVFGEDLEDIQYRLAQKKAEHARGEATGVAEETVDVIRALKERSASARADIARSLSEEPHLFQETRERLRGDRLPMGGGFRQLPAPPQGAIPPQARPVGPSPQRGKAPSKPAPAYKPLTPTVPAQTAPQNELLGGLTPWP